MGEEMHDQSQFLTMPKINENQAFNIFKLQRSKNDYRVPLMALKCVMWVEQNNEMLSTFIMS